MTLRTHATLSLVLVATASAAPVFIENAGFEQRALNPGSNDFAAPEGWDRTPGSSGQLGTFYPTLTTWRYTASEGNNLFFANGGSIRQTTAAQLTDGITYTLRVDVIARPTFFSGYTIQLLAGTTVIAEDTDGLTPPPGGFLVSELTYTASAADPLLGQSLTIVLSGPTQANFDNVRLDAVPAPGAACLLALAGLGAARRRRDRALRTS